MTPSLSVSVQTLKDGLGESSVSITENFPMTLTAFWKGLFHTVKAVSTFVTVIAIAVLLLLLSCHSASPFFFF